jgi:pimeloyl-ACP methyl ester carboxylesterase
MTDIVLVHGAFQGGWVWRPVAERLRLHGHEAFTPTLSGSGERAHLLNPSIGLNTYIEDVANLIFYESLQNVVLVGHSYAGMIITAVARKLPRRIAHLVYLDAVVPQPGQSFLDIAGIEFVRMLESRVAGWQVRPWPMKAFGIESKADRDWFETRLVPFPLKAFKSTFPRDLSSGTSTRTYIHCTGHENAFIKRIARQCRTDGWDYCELPTGHSAMVTAPGRVAALLDRLTQTRAMLQRVS